MPDFVRCMRCGRETYAGTPTCPHCGIDIPEGTAEDHARAREAERQAQHEAERERLEAATRHAVESGNWSGVPRDIFEAHAEEVILTTTFEVPGFRVDKMIDIVAAERVLEGIWGEQTSFLGGGWSAATQRALRDGRRACMTDLRREALEIGGNAVIGVELDYSEISGGGLFLVANGTAVSLVRA